MRIFDLLKLSGWLAAAFLAGVLYSGGPTVQAQDGELPMVELGPIGPNTPLLVHYPKAGLLYVYQQAFSGGPKRPCAYYFRLGKPGEPVRRELCPADLSDQ
jgi:hypothetical protein